MEILIAVVALVLFVWMISAGWFENEPPNHISKHIRDHQQGGCKNDLRSYRDEPRKVDDAPPRYSGPRNHISRHIHNHQNRG